jgi:hypothetical protein
MDQGSSGMLSSALHGLAKTAWKQSYTNTPDFKVKFFNGNNAYGVSCDLTPEIDMAAYIVMLDNLVGKLAASWIWLNFFVALIILT